MRKKNYNPFKMKETFYGALIGSIIVFASTTLESIPSILKYRLGDYNPNIVMGNVQLAPFSLYSLIFWLIPLWGFLIGWGIHYGGNINEKKNRV